MEFKGKKINKIGTFLIKNNIFGVKFEKDFIEEISEKSQKLYHIKKNFKLCMETKKILNYAWKQKIVKVFDKEI